MTDRRAQILRLHERGVPAVEICVRLLVSWQAVERVIGEARESRPRPSTKAQDEGAAATEVTPLAGRRRREESRQHLVDRAVQDGRVTRCPPAYGAPVAGAAPTGPLPHYTPPEARPGGWRAKAAAAVAARRQRANG